MKKQLLLYLLIFSVVRLFSQIGGTRSYRFLDIPMTARAAALGGNSMSVWGDDLNLVYSNPSLLNSTMHRQLALNYSNYVGDMNFGYMGYGHHLNKYGTVAGSIPISIIVKRVN